MKIILAQPRGFCAGVDRAIDIVEEALKLYGPPVYVRHEIVHNKRVVKDLKEKGAVFVEEIKDIPDGAVTVFSAHGVSRKVEDDAKTRKLPVLDATCPLVSKVHNQGIKYAKKGYEIILIGHEGHPEVEGTQGRIPGGVHLVSTKEDVRRLKVKDENKLAYVTQTTLGVDDTRDVIKELELRFPSIVGPGVEDICYATTNRQEAVRDLAKHVDLLLVVGSQNSSNSKRLEEIGREINVPSYLIDGPSDINKGWLTDVKTIGITAGASAPEAVVMEVIDELKKIEKSNVKVMDGIKERLPGVPYKHIAIDPYNNLKYQHYDDSPAYTADYTDDMRKQMEIDFKDYPEFKFHHMTDEKFMNTHYEMRPFDLVFFDGPHMTKDVMTEAIWFAPRTRRGTRFIFDDHNLN